MNGELTGVDPGFQIALTAASVAVSFPAKCAFYVRELARLAKLTGTGLSLLSSYEAVFLTQFLLASEFDASSAWRGTAAAAAHRRLDDVERILVC